MAIGINSQANLRCRGFLCRGFTYVEVLISFLLLSSGVLAYVMLVVRTELMQIQSNQTLNAIFMADYMVTHLALSARSCNSNNHCLVHKIELGVFDANSSLLKGYGWSSSSRANREDSLGCLQYDRSSNVFTVSIFYENQLFSKSKTTDCSSQKNSFQYVVRYALSSSFSGPFSE